MTNTFRAYKAIVQTTATVVVPQAGANNANGQSRGAGVAQSVIHALYISNVNATTAVKVNIDVYDGATAFRIGYQLPIAAGATLVLDKVVNLESGDRLRISVNTSNGDVEAIASVLEIS